MQAVTEPLERWLYDGLPLLAIALWHGIPKRDD